MSQPDELILISPYVNVAFSQENTYLYEKVNPMLGIAEAKVVGEYWAGDLDYNNYRISPINGNLSVLKKVNLFVGTREIMYPAVLELYKKLQNQNTPVDLYVGKGQNHVYPAIPALEGRIAIKQIINIIK
ncbi:alpha/beta hydrolase fold domain-containing protein [Staphylococcus succinus]|uniref:alpha/beta hydrolase fold domain-containing protein n=1 Tax=Staphylococcus succinus TaxID=61015 RepID=UPI0022B805D3|nr:alpha/beta hydrolase [Staphylococcus succinus]